MFKRFKTIIMCIGVLIAAGFLYKIGADIEEAYDADIDDLDMIYFT